MLSCYCFLNWNELKLSNIKDIDFFCIPLISESNKNIIWSFQNGLNLSMLSSIFTKIVCPKNWALGHEQQRKKAIEFIEQQIDWSVYLNLMWIIMPPIPSLYIVEYSQLIKRTSRKNLQVLIPVKGTIQSWKNWNDVLIISQSKNVHPILYLSNFDTDEHIVGRWIAETCKHFWLEKKNFINYENGEMDILPKIKYNLSLIVKNNSIIFFNGFSKIKIMKLYRNSFLKVINYAMKASSLLEQFRKYYINTLQSPLQPLRDNIPQQIYQLFEKDPIKYIKYEEAILKRLTELKNYNFTVIIFIAGAGAYGPLVDCALSALEKTLTKGHIFAIEKNSNAIFTLKVKQKRLWKQRVTIVNADIRVWKSNILADIIVSELLGSFGDNELSPECLKGILNNLKPKGISIPSSYSSWLAPISTNLIWNMCANMKMLETPWLIWINTQMMIGNPLKLWEFKHPKPYDKKIYNSRIATLDWIIELETNIHGFAGYFHCFLYKDIYISIEPSTHSPNMISWFPMFFPLKHPVYVLSNELLRLHMWRKTNNKDVWYEWCLSSPIPLPLQNSNGKQSSIKLN